MAAPAQVDDWTGEDVTIAQVERQLTQLRQASAAEELLERDGRTWRRH